MDKARIILGLMTFTNTTFAEPVSYMNMPSDKMEVNMYNSPVKYLQESEKLFERLNEFLELEDNWDGMGAISPMFDTIENVKHILDKLRDKHLKLLNTEDIVPSPFGTISVYFEDSEENEISIEVGKEYVGLSGEVNGSELIVDDIGVHDISIVIESVNQLKPLK